MSDAERYIDFIHNYCDRWCERCERTGRCRVFAMEQRAAAEPGARDPRNGRFWRILGEMLDRAQQMIREAAREQGIDLDHQDPSAYEQSEAQKRRAREDPLVDAGHAYAKLVDRWFAANRAHFEEKELEFGRKLDGELSGLGQDEESMQFLDALEVVRWYQYQIPVKLVRAVSSRQMAGPAGEDDGSQEDADGSAKVALIAMDRSLASWGVLRKAFLASQPQDAVLDLLLALDRLRRGTQQSFPAARSFIRPGFDDAPVG
jgi:hypothetical protein